MKLPAEYAKLWNKALDALARREHSVHELRRKLIHAATDAEVAAAVMTQLQSDGLVNDERFAEQLCRSKYRRGFGPVRVKYELNQHRLTPEIIEQAMVAYEGEWASRAVEVREKKFGASQPENYKDWAKQARFLQSRGFGSDEINCAVKRL